jgi:hypothetical protein
MRCLVVDATAKHSRRAHDARTEEHQRRWLGGRAQSGRQNRGSVDPAFAGCGFVAVFPKEISREVVSIGGIDHEITERDSTRAGDIERQCTVWRQVFFPVNDNLNYR